MEEKGKEYKLQWQATASSWYVFSEICKKRATSMRVYSKIPPEVTDQCNGRNLALHENPSVTSHPWIQQPIRKGEEQYVVLDAIIWTKNDSLNCQNVHTWKYIFCLTELPRPLQFTSGGRGFKLGDLKSALSNSFELSDTTGKPLWCGRFSLAIS